MRFHTILSKQQINECDRLGKSFAHSLKCVFFFHFVDPFLDQRSYDIDTMGFNLPVHASPMYNNRKECFFKVPHPPSAVCPIATEQCDIISKQVIPTLTVEEEVVSELLTCIIRYLESTAIDKRDNLLNNSKDYLYYRPLSI